jgi:hypothetical protein
MSDQSPSAPSTDRQELIGRLDEVVARINGCVRLESYERLESWELWDYVRSLVKKYLPDDFRAEDMLGPRPVAIACCSDDDRINDLKRLCGRFEGLRDHLGSPPPANLEIIAGGFAYRGKTYDLAGRSFQMLRALFDAKHHRMSRNDLRTQLSVNDDHVNYPDQVIADTAKSLRKALRKALEETGELERDGKTIDPLPSYDEGKNLAYGLNMP